jgi:hypothetical protein
MRKLVAALTAVVGLVILAGSFSLLQLPLSVFFMGLTFWEAVVACVVALVPAVASLALAVFLIRDRERIAAWYLPDDDAAPSASAESLLRVGLVLLGLYLVAQAIPALLALLTSPFVNWLQARVDTIYGDSGFADPVSWGLLVQSIPRALSALVSLTIGCLLLAKREWIIARIPGDSPVVGAEAEEAQARCQNCGASYDPSDYEGGIAEPLCADCKQPLDIPRT